MTITTDDILEHYGVKGMQWGVRKDKGHEGEKARGYKLQDLDLEYQQRSQMSRTNFRLHNQAARLTNEKDISRINNKPEYKNADFTVDSPLRQKYYKEHQDAYLKNVQKAADDVGTNASGTKKYKIETQRNGNWKVTLEDVQHAAEDEMIVKVNYDPVGHILSVDLPEELEQSSMSDITTEDVLAHYGVKGMRWGKRKGTLGEKTKAAYIENRTRQKDQFERLLDGEGLSRREKAINLTNRMTIGSKLTKKYYEKNLEAIDRDIDTVSAGNLSLRTKLNVALNTPVYQIALERKS